MVVLIVQATLCQLAVCVVPNVLHATYIFLGRSMSSVALSGIVHEGMCAGTMR